MKVFIVNNQFISDDIKKHIRASNKNINLSEHSSYSEIFSLLKADTDTSFFIIDTEDRCIDWRESIAIISGRVPTSKIILLTDSPNHADMEYGCEHNVVGFILKSFSAQQQQLIFDFIFAGGVFYPPIFNSKNQKNGNLLNEKLSSALEYSSLTNRQEEVLVNLCKGLSNKQIAHEMQLAEATVKLHVNALLRSLGVSNRTHAVITAQKLGIV